MCQAPVDLCRLVVTRIHRDDVSLFRQRASFADWIDAEDRTAACQPAESGSQGPDQSETVDSQALTQLDAGLAEAVHGNGCQMCEERCVQIAIAGTRSRREVSTML